MARLTYPDARLRALVVRKLRAQHVRRQKISGEPIGSLEPDTWLVIHRYLPNGGYVERRADADGQLQVYWCVPQVM